VICEEKIIDHPLPYPTPSRGRELAWLANRHAFAYLFASKKGPSLEGRG